MLLHVNAQVYALNRRVQAQNRAPDNFPGFVRNGFDVKVVGDGYNSASSGCGGGA